MTSRLDLINNVSSGKLTKRAIKQGVDYQIILKYPGNIASGIPVGEIRDKPVDDEDSLVLGSFSFPIVTYDTTEGKTTIVGFIDSVDTKLLPATKYDFVHDNFNELLPPTVAATQKNCWVYDIRTQDNSGNDIGLIDYGLVQVVERFTGD